VDAVLADSFPASDPPSWTLGVPHRPRGADATGQADATAAATSGREAATVEARTDTEAPASQDRAFLNALMSLAGAMGLALLVPFVMLLIGLPVAVAVRGVLEAVTWLAELIVG
jgi:hypothetical protein